MIEVEKNIWGYEENDFNMYVTENKNVISEFQGENKELNAYKLGCILLADEIFPDGYSITLDSEPLKGIYEIALFSKKERESIIVDGLDCLVAWQNLFKELQEVYTSNIEDEIIHKSVGGF